MSLGHDDDERFGLGSKRLLTPWSARAAFLAGLLTACLSAGSLLVQGAGGPADNDLVQQAAGAVGVNAAALGPALILASLWSAGQATFLTLATAHFVLRKAGVTRLYAYAGAGAAAALAWAAAAQILGFGAPDQGYVAEVAIGGCAGFFYRLFAGAKPERA